MHVGLVVFYDIDSGIDLANALHEAGASVTLYLSHAHTGKAVGAPDRPAERLYEEGLVPRECRVRLFHLPRMRDPRSLLTVRRIIRSMQEDGVDVAHVLMGPGELWLAVLAYLLRSLPVTSTMVIPRPNVNEELPDWVVLGAHKLLARGSEVVVVNGTTQVPLVQELYGLPAHRVVYVPLCARIMATRWPQRGVTEEPGTILFFGAARPHKGLEYLVRAQPLVTRRAPDARMLVVSRGEELDRCRGLVQDPDAFEIHEGFVPGDVMASHFRRASLVALPYLSASTSGVLLTAYGFGKPVVATRVGCLPEYVEDGDTGLLVPPEDVEALAEAIARLLSDEALRYRMGENARRWVGERQDKIAKLTFEAYERATRLHNEGARAGRGWQRRPHTQD